MKKILILVFILSCFCNGLLHSQADSIQPPFKRFPSFPPVKLLRTDSTTYFTKEDLPKKSAVLLMLFNPQCDHCQHETEDIVANIDKFKGIQIVMTTTMHFDSLTAFVKRYGLEKYDNIISGQDKNFMLPVFYEIHNLPFLAFYNRKKKLIRVFEGSMPIPQILSVFAQ
jgi:peroxiredoxin